MEKALHEKKGSFVGLLPLLAFLAIYFSMGIGTGNFDNFPLLIGMFVAAAISIVLKSPVSEKMKFGDRIELFCTGAGEKTLILMVIIYMLAGAFYSVAGGMHATDTVTNLGISILPAKLILPGLFLISCILSFAMGTSMGTISALIPIAVGISEKTGVLLPMVCGIVVGGAMFGDNLSFISDTTIAATATQNVSMKDKFRANILMAAPAFVFTLVGLFFWPIEVAAVEAAGPVDFVNLVPYVLIISLSLIGLHVILTIGFSVLTGVLIGVWHGDFNWIQSFGVIHEGMTWMQDMAMVAILTGGVIQMMKYLGGIDWLIHKLSKKTKTKKGAELNVAALVSLVDIATTNNTMAIIACGPIAKDISEKYEIPPSRMASILDLFSSAFNGIVPFAAQLLAAGTLAKISPMTITPYVWYSILMLVFGILFIVTGVGSKGVKAR